jgi:3-isopropylmalate/(R)-2-methylmalate dehydratase small subunit
VEPFTRISSTAVVLPGENIDTDQIIPARFLKVTDRGGLGDALFADWRYDADGRRISDFVLNSPRARAARVLVAGDNFGCGSSREHAPWALIEFGFRAIVSTRFADIFRSNAIANGLLPVTIEPGPHATLLDLLGDEPDTSVTIELETCTLHVPGRLTAAFPLDEFDRHCLIAGVDRLGYLLSAADGIDHYEEAHGVAPLTVAP